jgi:hypothetical protein
MVGLGGLANVQPWRLSSCLLLEKVDLVCQCSNLGELEWSRLFTPSSLEPGELSYEWREAGFMVLTIEPCSVPSLEISF